MAQSTTVRPGAAVACTGKPGALSSATALYANNACFADANNTFTFSLNFYVAQMGEYAVDGCAGTSPVLQMVPGATLAPLARFVVLGHGRARLQAPCWRQRLPVSV